MGQITVRADDALLERVRAAARAAGRSMNDYVSVVLAAATDPELSGSEVERVQERLARADLLIPREAWSSRPRARPSDEAIRRAGEEAARGAPVSDLLLDDR